MSCQDCDDAKAYAPEDATNVLCYACEAEEYGGTGRGY